LGQNWLSKKAGSVFRTWRFSAAVAGATERGRRIDNPPQVKNLPHNSSRRAENVMDSSTIHDRDSGKYLRTRRFGSAFGYGCEPVRLAAFHPSPGDPLKTSPTGSLPNRLTRLRPDMLLSCRADAGASKQGCGFQRWKQRDDSPIRPLLPVSSPGGYGTSSTKPGTKTCAVMILKPVPA
jgi:hypothetical protein